MRLFRLAKILSVSSRFGLDEMILEHEPSGRLAALSRLVHFWRRFDKPRAERLRLALEALGPIFVKFGQVLSTRRDLLPLDVADELAKLQDRVPPFPPEQALAQIEAAYGRPVSAVFAEFDPVPVASASVAQVHFARLHPEDGGHEVAVKILRPNMHGVIDHDLALLDTMAGLLEKIWSDGKRLKPREVVAEFAKYLHDSLPHATYVGFTGTPIDATLDVFGPTIDSYTMTESVNDQITVRIVYEGRAAKVVLDNSKLEAIEHYYQVCEAQGASEYQIEESKKTSANMNAILGDPDRIAALAKDFTQHYGKRVSEGSTVKGKAMFVCASREIAYDFHQSLKAERPEWFEPKLTSDGIPLSEQEQKELMPLPLVNMVMTRGQDDDEAMYDLLGSKECRKELDSAEQKVVKLMKGPDGAPIENEFVSEE